MKRLSLLLLILIAIPLTLLAGHEGVTDFVILHSNDTLYGTVKNFDLRNTTREITFYRKDEINTFTPADIRAFLVHRQGIDHYFESHKLTASQLNKLNRNFANADEMVFLYVYLKDKPLSLYFYQGQSPLYLIQRNDEAIAELDKPPGKDTELAKYRRVLTFYLTDMPESSKKIKIVRYNSRSLLSLTKDYNQYKQASHQAAYFQAKTLPRVQVGIFAGLTYTWLNFHSDVKSFDYLTHGTSSGSPRPALGISFNLNLMDMLPELTFYNELAYRSYKSEINHIAQDQFFRPITVSKIDVAYLRPSHMFRWTALNAPLKPFAQAGFWYSIAIKKETISTIEHYSWTNEVYQPYQTKDTFDNYGKGFKDFELGLSIGAGLSYQNISGELRYDLGNGMSNFLMLSAHTHTTGLFLTYRFL